MPNVDTTIAGHQALNESANSSQNINDADPASIASASMASTAVEDAIAHQDDDTALKADATAPPKDKGMFGQGQAGMKWSQKEVHDIPKNNMKLVFPGLLLAVFLAAMDQTIVSTALPIIVNNLDQGAGYSWVGRCYLLALVVLMPRTGSAYLLAAACSNSLWGRLVDLMGPKPCFYAAISIFLIGSALCGAAQTMLWLCLTRAVQGQLALACSLAAWLISLFRRRRRWNDCEVLSGLGSMLKSLSSRLSSKSPSRR
jgi:hypothetical protein